MTVQQSDVYAVVMYIEIDGFMQANHVVCVFVNKEEAMTYSRIKRAEAVKNGNPTMYYIILPCPLITSL